VRIDTVVTSGTFSLEGETFDVDNNVWLVGDDSQVVVVDAAHDAAPILAAVGDREVVALLITHAHDDHISAAAGLIEATSAPVWLHPDDRALWNVVHSSAPDHDLVDGAAVSVGDVELTALHVPGHSPGSTCLYAPGLGTLFSGDTLFPGGPGRTTSAANFTQVLDGLERRIFGVLPDDTRVCPGHGDETTLGTERPHLQEWRERGW
jgi:glyoxylase-like metal-dependent hydrolase (beta-lactamase superfamily II)